MIIKKDYEIVKAKGERKSFALNAKKESSDEECSTSESEDEEYAMAVRDFNKFFKKRECLKPHKDRTKSVVGGSWSDSGEKDDEKAKDKTCLVAQASKEDSGCSKQIRVTESSSQLQAYIGGQICDNKFRVTFSKDDSEITKDGKVIGRGIRKKGLYVMKLGNKLEDKICLATIDENFTVWHRRLGHTNMRLIQSLASKELVRKLPKLKFDQHFCDACKIRKQAHASHKAKNMVSTTGCLKLLHMDRFGPSAVRSYGGNLYTLVIVDDYSRMDHGREFDNEVQFGEFCNANGITHNFPALHTPQSNGVFLNESETPFLTDTFARVIRNETLRYPHSSVSNSALVSRSGFQGGSRNGNSDRVGDSQGSVNANSSTSTTTSAIVGIESVEVYGDQDDCIWLLRHLEILVTIVYVTPSQSLSTSPSPVSAMAPPMAEPFSVEVCLKPSSTAIINDVKFIVERDSLDIPKKSGKKSGMKAVVADKEVKEESQNGTANQVAATSFPKRLFKIGDIICKSNRLYAMAKSLELEENCFSKHFTEERDVLQGRFILYPPCSTPDTVLGQKSHLDR
ncbi:retrovirus-related pol polyprotein from transposon TNT 1-94 [Tanacetum coccineum]